MMKSAAGVGDARSAAQEGAQRKRASSETGEKRRGTPAAGEGESSTEERTQ